MAIVLQSFAIALWIVGLSLAVALQTGIGGTSSYRGGSYRGGGFRGGGGGFSGGGGRSGGGGSSRGF